MSDELEQVRDILARAGVPLDGPPVDPLALIVGAINELQRAVERQGAQLEELTARVARLEDQARARAESAKNAVSPEGSDSGPLGDRAS
jgi:hypothetical protein